MIRIKHMLAMDDSTSSFSNKLEWVKRSYFYHSRGYDCVFPLLFAIGYTDMSLLIARIDRLLSNQDRKINKKLRQSRGEWKPCPLEARNVYII